MAGSPYLKDVIDALFPHPVRFRQVWGQEWKHVSAFAWAAVPPPGFVAIGMALTATPEPPDVRSTRCVPKQWTRRATAAPALVWENADGGGRAASVWIVASWRGARRARARPPTRRTASSWCGEQMLPETSWRRNRRTATGFRPRRRRGRAGFAATRCRPPRLRSASGPTVRLGGGGPRAPCAGARMFEVRRGGRRREQAARGAGRDARTRGHRRVAALGASSAPTSSPPSTSSAPGTEPPAPAAPGR